jgi:anthranilate phosphoribosyltransferase
MSAPSSTAEFYAYVVKRLGRNAREGEHGVLDPDEATRLWNELLAQRFTPPQEAALLMGLRVHGESAAMLAAFARVTRDACASVLAPHERAVVVLHCLGTARKQPILAPLLALMLARQGVPALMVTHDAQRGVNTSAVLDALGEQQCADVSAATTALLERGFAWLPIGSISMPLARLLDRRAELGFRNSAHSLVKLLVPVDGRGLVVANYTHAPYRQAFAQAAERMGLSALLVRGTEGDPIAWETDAHPLLAWRGGQPVMLPPASTGTAAGSAALPAAQDVHATARFITQVLDGALPLPAAIAREVDCLAYLAG